MWLLKACPRCHGDLALNADPHGAFLECLQCGHVLSTEQERALGVRARRSGIAHRATPAAPPARAHPEPVAAAR